MNNNKLQQLTSYKQVSVGDTIICNTAHSSRRLLTKGKPDTAEVITIIHAGETYTLTELVTQEWKIQTTDGIYTHYANLAEAMHMVTRFIKETIRRKGTI